MYHGKLFILLEINSFTIRKIRIQLTCIKNYLSLLHEKVKIAIDMYHAKLFIITKYMIK